MPAEESSRKSSRVATGANLRRVFLGFHLTLAAAVLLQSVHAAASAAPIAQGAGRSWPLFVLATVEAGGAVLFLVPRTLQVGGLLLLATFAVAFVTHALRGEVPGTLLVYTAGTLLVMAHGSAWAANGSASLPGRA